MARIFLAGGTGVIGRSLIPALRDAGHTIVATTRKPERLPLLERLGATGAVVDVLDGAALAEAVRSAAPEIIVHELTDLSGHDRNSNARLRIDGTANLVEAARAYGVQRMVAESIAWVSEPGDGPADEETPIARDESGASRFAAIESLESAVLAMPVGIVLRYGLLYGPGTWYARDGQFGAAARAGTWHPAAGVASFVHVEDAATATVQALAWPGGRVNIVDDDPAPTSEWAPAFARAVGGRFDPADLAQANSGRAVSNARAHSLGWRPRWSSWREGFAHL